MEIETMFLLTINYSFYTPNYKFLSSETSNDNSKFPKITKKNKRS